MLIDARIVAIILGIIPATIHHRNDPIAVTKLLRLSRKYLLDSVRLATGVPTLGEKQIHT